MYDYKIANVHTLSATKHWLPFIIIIGDVASSTPIASPSSHILYNLLLYIDTSRIILTYKL